MALLMISVDWLSLSVDLQLAGYEPISRFGEDIVVRSVLDTGELISETVTGYQFLGSFDTSIRVRCDGSRVMLSGNPARFGRPHSLRPIASIPDALAVFCSIANSLLGLSLVVPSSVPLVGNYYETSKFSRGWSISRVDLCHQFAVGSAIDARRFVRGLCSVSRRGRSGQLHHSGLSVYWRSPRYASVKYYCKGAEIEVHAPDSHTKRLGRKLDSLGLVRHEVSLSSNYLRKHGLYDPLAWSIEKMNTIVKAYEMHKKVSVSINSFDEIAEYLTGLGVSKKRARDAQCAAKAWLAGDDLRPSAGFYSRSAYYRLRRDLLECGLDIATPANVSALPVRFREVEARSFSPRPASVAALFDRAA